jgi:hypothetical protein
MQYKLKKDLGNIKTGTELVKINNNYMLHSVDYQKYFTEKEIPLLIKQGWIEEIPEPKYTDEDMIKFAKSIQDDCYHTGIYEYSIDEKLKEYEACRQNKDIQ